MHFWSDVLEATHKTILSSSVHIQLRLLCYINTDARLEHRSWTERAQMGTQRGQRLNKQSGGMSCTEQQIRRDITQETKERCS